MIPAIVLQKNDTVYISTGGVSAQKSGGTEITSGLGLATVIPTPGAEGGVIDADYWAVPVGEGIISGFNFIPYNPNDPIGSVSPDVQAFKICRIYNRFASDYWYIVGTVAQYITAAGGGAALPTTIASLMAGYQVMCVWNAASKYFAVLALPTLVGNARYFPYGYLNGVALPAGANTGYATSAALLTFLNASWTNLGSPITAITWTVSADGITLLGVETLGGGTDKIEAQIAAINPSL